AASAGVSSSSLFTGGSLLRVSAYTYFIKNNGQGEPALYRLALRGGAIQTEEIVPGIEDMQIVYGVDTDATADSSVDEYVTADQVTSVAPGATVADQWRRVLAVRISLLAASYSGQEPNASQQTYRFNGADIVATDRKVRKVMTMTMAVRNRL
ncbi:MAG: hypothetical protein RLZ44_973, partial [Pseudomonadota bacterium]